jgi:RNA polymerase sigma factor (sigma-70 family)
MTETQKLLAEYARNSSETAFRELVTRYVDLVYSTAVRMVEGDAHRAQDVTQTVFADLARKAAKLSDEIMLGGWLHRHTCYVAANVMRGERRRRQRERTAAEMNANEDHSEANLSEIRPVLDDAINQLGPDDRTAILLRYFDKHDLRAVGAALGATENAAQKRVSRALDELRGLLKRRGVALSAAALGTALSVEAVSAAPMGLGIAVATTALTGGAAGSGVTATFLNFISLSKIKAVALVAMVTGSVATCVVIENQSQARVRDADNLIQEQAARINQLQVEQASFASRAAQLSPNNLAELLRLRDEAARLRERTNSIAILQAKDARMLAALQQARRGPPHATSAPGTTNDIAKEEAIARLGFAKQLCLAVVQHSFDNQGRFPTGLDQVTTASLYLNTNAGIRLDQFEMVYHGTQDEIGKYADPGRLLVIREKQPWRASDGRWAKAYAFADGSGVVHSEADGNFEKWEKERTAPAPATK